MDRNDRVVINWSGLVSTSVCLKLREMLQPPDKWKNLRSSALTFVDPTIPNPDCIYLQLVTNWDFVHGEFTMPRYITQSRRDRGGKDPWNLSWRKNSRPSFRLSPVKDSAERRRKPRRVVVGSRVHESCSESNGSRSTCLDLDEARRIITGEYQRRETFLSILRDGG